MSRLQKYLHRYRQSHDGATAVEFAILAIPFFMLIFAIIELAIIFFINSTMSHAVSEAGRQIRTGNMQSCGSEVNFKKLVCAEMDGIGNCESQLRVDVVSSANFKSIVLPADPLPTADPLDPTKTQVPAGSYTNAVAAAPVVIRAQYYHELALPPIMTRLENLPGTGVRVLQSTTAFRTEPYPAPGACPVT